MCTELQLLSDEEPRPHSHIPTYSENLANVQEFLFFVRELVVIPFKTAYLYFFNFKRKGANLIHTFQI